VLGAAEAEIHEVRVWLARALLERYGAVLTGTQWAVDPLILHLGSTQAAWIHDDVMRLAAGAAQKGPQRR
jgi:hypothetical protein